MLIQTAMELKDEYTGQDPGSEMKAFTSKRLEYWTSKSVSIIAKSLQT